MPTPVTQAQTGESLSLTRADNGWIVLVNAIVGRFQFVVSDEEIQTKRKAREYVEDFLGIQGGGTPGVPPGPPTPVPPTPVP